MRIGMFADMYTPHVSGVTNHIRLLKRGLERAGHECWVFTFGNSDHVDDEARVIRSPGMPVGDTGWNMGLALSRAARETAAKLDIAHAHHPFLSGRVALKVGEQHDIPVVFTNHTRYDLYSDVYAPFVPKKARYKYLRTYLNTFASDVDLVIAPSQGIVEWLRDFGITDSAALLPNAVDTKPFARPENPSTRSELGLAEDAVVLAYVGRVSHEKNIDVLLEAFIAARERVERLQLMIVGDGPERENAERRVTKSNVAASVRFLGSTPYDEIPNRLAVADAFVTASVSEVHPLVVIEAMAAGLPVLGIVSPGISDTVEHEVSGLLSVSDAAALTEAMVRIAHDEQLRADLARGARDRATHYDITPMTQKLISHYERILDEHDSAKEHTSKKKRRRAPKMSATSGADTDRD